jgi:hypothetical protein
MRTALYYPHTEIRSAHLLKTCLLLWDQLEFIVPFEYFQFTYQDKEIAEAIELVGVRRAPSDQEKREVHELIEDLATGPLPAPFYYQSSNDEGGSHYEMYRDKLLPQTWTMLQELHLASGPQANEHALSQATGLTITSLLADCCAGDTRSRITDRAAAYAKITNLMLDEQPPVQGDHEVVVPLTLKLIGAHDLSLERLIAFRKREAKEAKGKDLQGLRHNYAQMVETHVTAVRDAKRAADRVELERIFEADMAKSLHDLEKELGFAGKNALYSNAAVVTIVAGAAAFGSAMGLPIEVPAAVKGIGGLVTVGGRAAASSLTYSFLCRFDLTARPAVSWYSCSVKAESSRAGRGAEPRLAGGLSLYAFGSRVDLANGDCSSGLSKGRGRWAVETDDLPSTPHLVVLKLRGHQDTLEWGIRSRQSFQKQG